MWPLPNPKSGCASAERHVDEGRRPKSRVKQRLATRLRDAARGQSQSIGRDALRARLERQKRYDFRRPGRVIYPALSLMPRSFSACPATCFLQRGAQVRAYRSNVRPEVVQWGPSVDATEGMSGGAWIVNFDTSRSTGRTPRPTLPYPLLPNTRSPERQLSRLSCHRERNQQSAEFNSVSNGCKYRNWRLQMKLVVCERSNLARQSRPCECRVRAQTSFEIS